MRAVDTNMLVRALVQDDPAAARRAQDLLLDHQVYVPVMVLLELEWVLRRRYGLAPAAITQALEKLAALENVVVGVHAAVVAAAGKMAQGWDFADALHHALSHGCADFVTLDAGLVKQARRINPLDPPVTRL